MRKINLISISKAALLYQCSEEGFYSSASIYKKKNGHPPKWYIDHEVNGIMIDTIEYERLGIMERRAWLYATNDLYFILTYDFNLTDTQIARFLTRHSKIFTNQSSWSSFITKTLFSLPRESVIQKRLSMTVEFCYTASYLITILLQEERNCALQR